MKVTLLTAHEHAGVSYAAGDTIDIPESDVEFLKTVGACAIDVSPEPAAEREIPLTASGQAYERSAREPMSVEDAAARVASITKR